MSVERNLPLVRERKQALLQGDPERIAKQKASGKLTARERIENLLDAKSFVELDALAGREAPSGVVTGYGLIDGRPVYVYAQDFTVMGGSVGMEHAKKVLKVMSLAQKTGAPVVALSDSAGARIPEGVDALNAYSEVLAQMAALSGVVPQISLVLGPCAGAAALAAAMSDVVITSANGRLFINGPQVVSAASGKEVSAEQLGGLKAQTESGVAHLAAETDEGAIALARKLVMMLPANNLEDAPLDLTGSDDLNREIPELNEIDQVTDVKDVLVKLVDSADLLELSGAHAPEMVTALGQLGGRTVGLVANQPSVDGGALSVRGCAKAARFVRLCDCFNIPVVSLVDTEGFKVSCACAQGDLARACAQLTYAYHECTAPRLAVVCGKAIGAGYVAMASRSASDAVYAWPGSVIAPLNAPAAVQVLMKDRLMNQADGMAKRAELEAEYQDKVADGLNAAKLGYVDDIIEPAATRQMLAAALEMLSSKRDSRPSKKHGNLPL